MSLPAAWSDYIDSAGGASCLGPRSGLQAQHHQYHAALEKLADPAATTWPSSAVRTPPHYAKPPALRVSSPPKASATSG